MKARASPAAIEAAASLEKTRRRQERFIRNVKRTVNWMCIVGILLLLIYTIFFAPEQVEPTEIRVFEK